MHVKIASLLLTAVLFGPMASARQVTLCKADKDVAPFSYVNRESPAEYLVRRAIEKQGDTALFIAAPWPRCLQGIRDGDYEALMAAYPNSSFQSFLRFPEKDGRPDRSRAVATISLVVLHEAGSNATWNGRNFERLTKPILRLATVEMIRAKLAELHIEQTIDVKKTDDMVQLLLSGQAELAITFANQAQQLVARPEIRGKIDLLPIEFMSGAAFTAVDRRRYDQRPSYYEAIWDEIGRQTREKDWPSLAGKLAKSDPDSAVARIATERDSLTLVSHDDPPFTLQAPGGGEVTGINTDIIREALEKAGIAYSIALYPWARAYNRALTEVNVCIYTTSRTEQREPLFRWIGPLTKAKVALFGRKDSRKVASLDDIRDEVTGGYYADAMTAALKARGLKVDEAAGDDLNVNKLRAGRIDYWITNDVTGAYQAKLAGDDLLVPILTLGEINSGLACNLSVPEDLVARLNAILREMQEDGSVELIRQRYQ